MAKIKRGITERYAAITINSTDSELKRETVTPITVVTATNGAVKTITITGIIADCGVVISPANFISTVKEASYLREEVTMKSAKEIVLAS